jgi:6-phosphogluconate dehydrogenase
MRFGIIGLGRMGAALARNAHDHGHVVVAWNRSSDKVDEFVEYGGKGASSIEALVSELETPRIVWLMLPSGDTTEQMITTVLPLLEPGDVIINGANEHYERSKAHAALGAEHGVQVLDAGVSGGISGARNGACAMVGGDADAYALVEPLFVDVCVENGCGYVGPAGAGHYAKMVHNAIEYGMMESIGEGFDLIHASEYDYDDAKLSRIWANGSVIRSWLIDLLVEALETKGLESFPDEIGQSGEGLWSLREALDRKIATPAIQAAVNRRFLTKQDHSAGNRVIQALRAGFGGHDAKDHI